MNQLSFLGPFCDWRNLYVFILVPYLFLGAGKQNDVKQDQQVLLLLHQAKERLGQKGNTVSEKLQTLTKTPPFFKLLQVFTRVVVQYIKINMCTQTLCRIPWEQIIKQVM